MEELEHKEGPPNVGATGEQNLSLLSPIKDWDTEDQKGGATFFVPHPLVSHRNIR